jgi:hypothetical protein
MRIGSGLSVINNLYITPNYPERPVDPIQKVNVSNYNKISDIGSFNSMKAMVSHSSSQSRNVSFVMPDGGLIVGYFIDVFA